MRWLGLAAIAGLSIAITAEARIWSDPAGRVTFDAPNGWITSQERGAAAGDTFSYMITGNANNECHVIAVPNSSTANASADATRRAAANSATFSNEFWATLANGTTSVFPNNSAVVQTTDIDAESFWPVARAEIRNSERLVHAYLQIRPGMELRVFCQTYAGADAVNTYNTFARSVGHPNDAALRADAERQASEREAAAAAAAAQPAEQSRENRRRNN